jgi:hypothetical protein
MGSLANDIKKNSKKKVDRQIVNTPNNQQQSITTMSTNDIATPVDNVQMEVII